jgi:nucleotide-binding universal stress UspA family protein
MTRPIERASVLAASDLTDGSEAGIISAATLASAAGARLHAYHCIPKPVFPFWEGTLDEGTRQRWLDNARLDLEWQLRRLIGDTHTVATLEVGLGEAASEINRHAASISADLIVLGAHRPRGMFDDLLGTTADRVIRTAAVPCLIANRPQRTRPGRVLVPVDFSEPSKHSVRIGMDWLAALGAPAPSEPLLVEILYVSAFASPSHRPMAVEPRLSEQASSARTRLQGLDHWMESALMA